MDFKKVGKNILYPPIWVMLSLCVISAAALVFVFIKGMQETVLAYAIYVIAFYTLVTVCMFFWLVLPKKYKRIKQKIYDNPIGKRYITDAEFRTHISLYLSLTINLLYVGINILSFILYRSMWFVVLAGYYIILAIMRFVLVRYVRKNELGENMLGELKSTMFCASILLLLNFVLTGAIMMILYQNKGFNYHGILIYVMATYTFYTVIHAIINLVKHRKYPSPVMRISKVIALSAALVSVLALETAMLSQFGQDMSAQDKWLMIALTGAGVSVTVVTLSVYMIVRAKIEINKIKGKNYGKQGRNPEL